MTNVKSGILARFHAPIIKFALSLCAIGIASAARANFVMKTGTTTANWSDEGLWVGDDGNYVIDYNSPNADITFTAAESIASGFWLENADGLVVFEASDPSYGLTMTGGDMHVGGVNYGYLKISSGTHIFAEKLYVAYSQAWWENPDPTSKGSVTVDYGTLNVVDSVILGNISGSDGAIYLSGGTLSTKSIVKGEGAGKVEFYGGALKATATGTLIGSGLTVNVPSGYTGTIDTSGFDVTVESAVGGSGTLNIVGGGRVTFTTMPGCRVLSADDTPYVFPVQTYYWIGGSSGDWNNGANWSFSKGGVAANEYPNAGDALVKITSRTTISVGATYYAGSLYIDDGVVVTLTGGGMLAGIRNLGESATVGDKIVLDGVNLESAGLSASEYIDWYSDIDVGVEQEVNFYCNNREKEGSTTSGIRYYGNLSGSGTLNIVRSGHTNKGTCDGRANFLFYGNNESFSGVCHIALTGTNRGGATFQSATSGSALARWINDMGADKNSQVASIAASGSTIKFGSYEGNCYIFGCGSHSGNTIEIGALNTDFSCSLSATASSIADRANNNATLRKVGTGTMTFGNATGNPCFNYYEMADGILKFANPSILSSDTGGSSSTKPSYKFTGGAISFTDGAMVDGKVVDISALIKNSTGAISVYVDSYPSVTWATALDSSNKGGLVKDGYGTLTLGAIPQYVGDTVVRAGKLVVPFKTSLTSLELGEDATIEVDMTGATENTQAFSVGTFTGDKTKVTLVNNTSGFEFSLVETAHGFVFVNGSKSYTWQGPVSTESGNDYNWSTPGNWGEETDVPTSADNVSFPADSTVYVDSAVSVFAVSASGALTVNGPSNAKTSISAQSLAVNGSLTVSENVALTVASMEVAGKITMTQSNIDSNSYADNLADANVGSMDIKGGFSGSGVLINNGTLELTGNDSFIGSIGGGQSVTKKGDDTYMLIGNNTFTGGLAIEKGTLKLGSPKDIADVRMDFDASDTDSFTVDEATGYVTAWKDQINNLSFNYASGQHATLSTDFFGGKNAFSMTDTAEAVAEGAKVVTNYKLSENNKDARSKMMFIAYQASLASEAFRSIYTEDQQRNFRVHIRGNDSAHYWCWHNGGSQNQITSGFYMNDVYGNGLVTQNPQVLGVADSLIRNKTGGSAQCYEVLGSYADTAECFKGGIGEIISYNRNLTHAERKAVDAYLMAKWGAGSATYNVIPAEADVTMKSGATLDMGGLTQTVTSFTGAGTVTNGYLKTTGDLTVDGGTLTIQATTGQTYVLSDVETERLVLTGDAKGYTVKVPDNGRIVGRFIVPEGISVGFEGEGADVTVVNAPKGWEITGKPVAGGILYRVGSFPFVLKLR